LTVQQPKTVHADASNTNLRQPANQAIRDIMPANRLPNTNVRPDIYAFLWIIKAMNGGPSHFAHPQPACR
jgi:hypothetical protein